MERDPGLDAATAAPGFSIMQRIRNSRLGMFMTAGAAVLMTAGGELALAEPVAADGATDSAARLKPAWVTDEIANRNNLIAHQRGFTQIRPKKASIGGDWMRIWGGLGTCRPGQDRNPILFMYLDYPDKYVSGVCPPGRVGGGSHASYSPDHFTAIMNGISSKVVASAGVRGQHGDTVKIKANLKTAVFTFSCSSLTPNMVRSFTINQQGRRQAAQRCAK